MRRAALLGVLLALLLVGGASADWGPGDPHDSVFFTTANSRCAGGSDSSIDDLPARAGGFAVELWLRPDSYGWYQAMAHKFSTNGWHGTISLNQFAFQAYVTCATTTARSDVNWSTGVAPAGLWYHVLWVFTHPSQDGDGKIYHALNGQWATSYAVQNTCVGAYGGDATLNLTLGNRAALTNPVLGNLAWMRFSDADRYTVGVNFTPPVEVPTVDDKTIELWAFDEGTGSTVVAAVASANNCTLTDAVWERFDTQLLRNQLTAWWDLEENVGTRYDAHINDQDLTDNNTVSRNTGKVNYASDFNAASYEYLSREDGSAISTGDISYTVGAWVYMDVVTDSTIVGKGDEYALRYDTNHFEFLTGNSVTTETVAAATPAPAATTTWCWLAGYHDRGAATIGIYRNTTLNTEAYVNGGHDGDQALYVARRGDLYLDGRVDEAVVFKGWVPNHDENAWFYNGGSGRSYSDLPMPTPTPTPTPVPTPTPSPTPITSAVYLASLPSGGVGVVSASVSAGEAMIVVVGLLLLFLLLYRTLSEKVRLWWTTR